MEEIRGGRRMDTIKTNQPTKGRSHLTKKQKDIMERMKSVKNIRMRRKLLLGKITAYRKNAICLFVYLSVCLSVQTLRRMLMMITEMSRKRNCLRYQELHNTHCFRPIINMDSRIRDSFSSTSSCEQQ